MRPYQIVWLLFAVALIGFGISYLRSDADDAGEGGLQCAYVGLIIFAVLALGTILERVTTGRKPK